MRGGHERPECPSARRVPCVSSHDVERPILASASRSRPPPSTPLTRPTAMNHAAVTMASTTGGPSVDGN
jgi:hypothetical protein